MTLNKIAVLLIVANTFFGCKKDNKTVPDVNYEGGARVSFNNYMDDNGQPGYLKVDFPLVNDFAEATIELKLTNTTEVAANDIAVYLTKVDALVSDYNTAHGTTLEAVPTATLGVDYDFTRPLVIKKGQRKAVIPIKVNPLKLNLNKQNAMGIAIERVEGATVDQGKSSELVVEFGARNKYDGYYKMKGFVTHPTAAYTGPFSYDGCGEVALITSGANSVDLDPGQLFSNAGTLTVFSVFPRFTVDPATNKVTITDAYPPAGVSFSPPITTYNSRYEPATKTFYVKYGWNTSREATDTLVYCGPR